MQKPKLPRTVGAQTETANNLIRGSCSNPKTEKDRRTQVIDSNSEPPAKKYRISLQLASHLAVIASLPFVICGPIPPHSLPLTQRVSAATSGSTVLNTEGQSSVDTRLSNNKQRGRPPVPLVHLDYDVATSSQSARPLVPQVALDQQSLQQLRAADDDYRINAAQGYRSYERLFHSLPANARALVDERAEAEAREAYQDSHYDEAATRMHDALHSALYPKTTKGALK